MEKAVGFLHQSGHIAKAKAILGSVLSQKETTIDDESVQGQNNFTVVGNPMRQLWKKVAWTICDEEGMSKWERGIIGACCGHRKSMTAVANSWEDKVCLKMLRF